MTDLDVFCRQLPKIGTRTSLTASRTGAIQKGVNKRFPTTSPHTLWRPNVIKPDKGIVLTPKTKPFYDMAVAFRKLHGLKLRSFEEGSSGAKALCLSEIKKAPGPLEVVAYFGHAWTDTLSSANIGLRDLPSLAEAIQSNSSITRIIVLLYGCGAGTPGGFAQRLQQKIGPRAVVYGHEGPMAANTNPYKRRYPKGEYVVAPDSPFWCKWLQVVMRDGYKMKSDLWMRYAFMTEKELHDELKDVPTPETLKTYPKDQDPKTYKCPT
jgi:hypothetical protein